MYILLSNILSNSSLRAHWRTKRLKEDAFKKTKVTGHKVQVTALLLNNWDKQFPIKVKFYFGLWLGLEDTFSVVYLS